MAYRKQWYTFGARTNAEMLLFPDSELKNGDTYFSTDWGKTMYLNDTTLISGQIGCDKIWLNEDMIFGYDPSNNCTIGTPVSISVSALFSANAISLPLLQATSSTYKDFVGVVAMVPNPSISSSPQGRGVAIQGIYNVLFTVLTNGVTAGNWAVLSSTAGQASQSATNPSTGVIGVIMETKAFSESDRLAKVMIQSFSSK